MAGARARAHGTACPAPSCIASSPPSPALCYFFFFPSSSEHGAVMRAEGAATGCRGRRLPAVGCYGYGAPRPSSAVSSVSWPPLPWLLTGAILSLDQWASVGVWVTATEGVLGGGLQAGKSRWDFPGDSSILPPQHTLCCPVRFQ